MPATRRSERARKWVGSSTARRSSCSRRPALRSATTYGRNADPHGPAAAAIAVNSSEPCRVARSSHRARRSLIAVIYLRHEVAIVAHGIRQIFLGLTLRCACSSQPTRGARRSMASCARSNRLPQRLSELGVSVEFLTPDGFPSFPLPTYPGLRCALPPPARDWRRIERAKPDAIHIATEGPVGHMVRRFCRKHRHGRSRQLYHAISRYISARVPNPGASLSYALLRRFHSAAAITMVSTPSLMAELSSARLQQSRGCGRAASTPTCFGRTARSPSICRDPIFVCAGRVAVEKNLEAFLSLDLPGSKVVIGEGPARTRVTASLSRREFSGCSPASQLAAPCGCGRRVRVSQQDRHVRGRAARGACLRRAGRGLSGDGPRDVIGNHPVGALDDDLRAACMKALAISRGRLPRLCARALLGEQRPAIHRACQSRRGKSVRVGTSSSRADFRKRIRPRRSCPRRVELAT